MGRRGDRVGIPLASDKAKTLETAAALVRDADWIPSSSARLLVGRSWSLTRSLTPE
jgi:hypothetical protein